MNMKISYLYRDGSNYKQYEFVIVEVPDGTRTAQVEETLRRQFSAHQLWPDVIHFKPEDLGWPTAYFDEHDKDDDLDVHELEAVEPTDEPATERFELAATT